MIIIIFYLDGAFKGAFKFKPNQYVFIIPLHSLKLWDKFRQMSILEYLLRLNWRMPPSSGDWVEMNSVRQVLIIRLKLTFACMWTLLHVPRIQLWLNASICTRNKVKQFETELSSEGQFVLVSLVIHEKNSFWLKCLRQKTHIAPSKV